MSSPVSATELSVQARLSELLIGGSFELLPREMHRAAEIAALLPADTCVYIPSLPGLPLARTLEAVKAIREAGLDPVPHVSARRILDRAEFQSFLKQAVTRYAVHRVLLLGGDEAKPKGPFADSLQILESGLLKDSGIKEIGVAGYPEGHPQCLNRTRDLEYLKRKVDNGGNFVVTQLFFDNADFYRFRDEARAMGINVPIVAGIMPITNVNQIKRFVSMCGAKIPHRLLTKLEALDDNPDTVHQVGVDYAAMQCEDLLFNDCQGLHFYTLNKSKATVDIVKRLDIDHAA